MPIVRIWRSSPESEVDGNQRLDGRVTGITSWKDAGYPVEASAAN